VLVALPNMLKKFLIVTMLVVFCVVCAVLAPWQNWNFNITSLFGITPPEKFARLQVSSLAGEIEIVIDGEVRGSVGPEGSPLLIEDIKPGQRLVKLVRVGEKPEAYISFERLANFSSDIDTVIAYELGPSEQFSEGHVISAFKNYLKPDTTLLNVNTTPSDVKVSLDGAEIGRSPLQGITLDTTAVHKLRLEKQGYEPLEISLLPESPDERAKLVGYEINVEANLFLIPLKLD
jgi:hypothetical protein